MGKKYYGALIKSIFASLSTIVAVCAAMSSTTMVARAASDETPIDILAVRVREQGFACETPKSAERLPEQSAPNETVWLLKCEDAAYKVRLVPDLAAKNEKLKD